MCIYIYTYNVYIYITNRYIYNIHKHVCIHKYVYRCICIYIAWKLLTQTDECSSFCHNTSQFLHELFSNPGPEIVITIEAALRFCWFLRTRHCLSM